MIGRWAVCFVDGPPTWWSRWLRPDYRHVYALGFDPLAGHWVLVDSKLGFLNVRVVEVADVDRMLTAAVHQGGVICADVQDRPRTLPRPLYSCVTVIEHLLGMPGGAWTPYRLYRRMLRAGAAEWPRLRSERA